MNKEFINNYQKTEYYNYIYKFTHDDRFVSNEEKCVKCGENLDIWSTEADCCGYPFSCTTTIIHRACHKCKIITNGF